MLNKKETIKMHIEYEKFNEKLPTRQKLKRTNKWYLINAEVRHGK